MLVMKASCKRVAEQRGFKLPNPAGLLTEDSGLQVSSREAQVSRTPAFLRESHGWRNVAAANSDCLYPESTIGTLTLVTQIGAVAGSCSGLPVLLIRRSRYVGITVQYGECSLESGSRPALSRREYLNAAVVVVVAACVV